MFRKTPAGVFFCGPDQLQQFQIERPDLVPAQQAALQEHVISFQNRQDIPDAGPDFFAVQRHGGSPGRNGSGDSVDQPVVVTPGVVDDVTAGSVERMTNSGSIPRRDTQVTSVRVPASWAYSSQARSQALPAGATEAA